MIKPTYTKEFKDDFFIIQNMPDRYKPIVKHRELKMIKTGTCFFGLLNTYKLTYTDWKES